MTLVARIMKTAPLVLAALLAACGGGGGGSSGGVVITDAGTLKLALAAAPACGFDSVDLTLQKVRVHPSSAAADADPGWSEVTLNPAQRIDLLSLTNGNVRELGQVTLPVGKYRQMSLVLAANDAASPLANAVTPFARAETALGTPASLQPGLKIAVDIDIVKDQTSDYVLDFDACNSVLRVGQSGNYDLSPRYTTIRRVSATGMRVTGFVASTLDRATTRVSLQSNGVAIRTTAPDANGRFVLYPVPAGSYDLVVSAPGRVTAIVTGVPVADAAATDLNAGTAPIDPAPSTPHTATGTVSTGTMPIDATVQVIKKYTGGPSVVIAGAPVDAGTGGLSYALSSGAPVRTTYGTSVPLSFDDDDAAAGLYTIAVTSGGVTKTHDVDVTSGDPPAVSFAFP